MSVLRVIKEYRNMNKKNRFKRETSRILCDPNLEKSLIIIIDSIMEIGR